MLYGLMLAIATLFISSPAFAQEELEIVLQEATLESEGYVLYPDTNAAPGWDFYSDGPSNSLQMFRGMLGGRTINRQVRGDLGASYSTEMVMKDPDKALNGIAALLNISASPAAGCLYPADTVGVSAKLVVKMWSDGLATIQSSLRVRKLRTGGYIADTFLEHCFDEDCALMAEQGFPGLVAGPRPAIKWDGEAFVYSIGGERIQFSYIKGPWNKPSEALDRRKIVVTHDLPVSCESKRIPRSSGRVSVSKVWGHP